MSHDNRFLSRKSPRCSLKAPFYCYNDGNFEPSIKIIELVLRAQGDDSAHMSSASSSPQLKPFAPSKRANHSQDYGENLLICRESGREVVEITIGLVLS